MIITAVKKHRTRDGTEIGGGGVLFYGGQGGLLEKVTFGQGLKTMRKPARGTRLQEDQVQPPGGTGMFIVFEEERGSWGGLMEARRRVGDEVRGGKRAQLLGILSKVNDNFTDSMPLLEAAAEIATAIFVAPRALPGCCHSPPRSRVYFLSS